MRPSTGAPVTQIRTAIGGDYQPFAGDFDGDGRDDVFLYAPGSAQDYVAYAGATRGSFTKVPFTVNGNYRPFVGDFNGDGIADVFWYAPGKATSYIWFGQSNRTFTQRTMTIGGDFQGVAGDFNCDGHTDIVWYSPSGGSSFIWTSTGGAHWHWAGIAIPPHAILRAADFNGDACSDLLVYTPGPGADELLLGSSFGGFKAVAVDQPGNFDPLVGDFDHNGRADVFWYTPNGSTQGAWYSESRVPTFAHGGGHVYYPVRPVAGDFDGDGQTDMLWLDPHSGISEMWFDVRNNLLLTDGVQWVRQFGTPDVDAFGAVATDSSGDYYAVGVVDQGCNDARARASCNGADAVVVKYDSGGQLLWQHQFGSTSDDGATGVGVDRFGDVYVGGWTFGHISGAPEHAGGTFIARYTPGGTRVWIHQFGDVTNVGVAAFFAGGGGYVGGSGRVTAFTDSGVIRWSRADLPGSGYGGVAITQDGDAVVATGPFVGRFRYADGSLEWARSLGVSNNGASGVATDIGDHVDIVGQTGTQLPGAPEPPAGGTDAFVAQYSGEGTQYWVHRIATPALDSGNGVAVDGGDVLVAGNTLGTLPEAIEGSAGSSDAFVEDFDVKGNRVWAHQFGGAGYDWGLGVAQSNRGAALVGEAGDGVPGTPTPDNEADDGFIALFPNPR